MKVNSPEFREIQRERIYRTKPWEKSTGPKTLEGRERSKMNALKTSPQLYLLAKEMKYLMKLQKEIWHYVSE